MKSEGTLLPARRDCTMASMASSAVEHTWTEMNVRIDADREGQKEGQKECQNTYARYSYIYIYIYTCMIIYIYIYASNFQKIHQNVSGRGSLEAR